jgi:hypothetical protein
VTGVAGFISYTHICALTLDLHQSWQTAHLMPFAVDGQIIVGSVVLLAARGRTAWWGWLGIVPGLAESLFANWESGIRYGLLAAIWAIVAAQAFAVASFMLERWLKSQVGHGGRDGQPEEDSNDDRMTGFDTDTCAHLLPRTAAESAVYAFLHARDCLNEPLSQRQLAAAFEMTRQRVAELVGPLSDPVPALSSNGSGPHA